MKAVAAKRPTVLAIGRCGVMPERKGMNHEATRNLIGLYIRRRSLGL